MRKEEYKLNLKNDDVFKMMHYYKEETGKRIFASSVESFTGIEVLHVVLDRTDLYPIDITEKEVHFDLRAAIDTKRSSRYGNADVTQEEIQGIASISTQSMPRKYLTYRIA